MENVYRPQGGGGSVGLCELERPGSVVTLAN